MENQQFNPGDKIMLKLDNNQVLIFLENVGDGKAKCVDVNHKEVIVYLVAIEPYKFHSFL